MNCVHRWNCDLIPAVCLYCGDEKEFKVATNYYGSYAWGLSADIDNPMRRRRDVKRTVADSYGQW